MKKLILRVIGVVIFAAVFSGIAYLFLKDYESVVVTGDAMYPTFEENDKVVVDTAVEKYERFDIIVCENSYDGGGRFIERIVGMPGERVRIQEGVIYINGEPLEDPYYYEKEFYGYDAYEEVTLGEDEYFVLGDNRNHSADSRMSAFGAVKLSSICGKAVFRLWPMDAIGSLKLQ